MPRFMCFKLKVTIRLWVCECEQNEEKPNARSDSTQFMEPESKNVETKKWLSVIFPSSPHLTLVLGWSWCPVREMGTIHNTVGRQASPGEGHRGNNWKRYKAPSQNTENWAVSRLHLHGSWVPGWGWGWLSDWWWTNDARIVGDTPQKIIGGVIISIISSLDTRNDHYLCGNSDIQISAHLNLPLRSISSNVCELANGLLRIMRMYPNFKQQLTKTWPYPHRGWSQCTQHTCGGWWSWCSMEAEQESHWGKFPAMLHTSAGAAAS